MLTMPRTAAFALLCAGILTIGGAWIFQWAGHAPCPLCLMQRWAWYALILLAALLAWKPFRPLFGLAAAIMIGSAIFGAYHSGVEWKWWPGPDTCGGELSGGLPNLTGDPVIRCDEAAIRILGLSLAGWNAVISLALAGLAAAQLKAR